MLNKIELTETANKKQGTKLSYILITPARNEEAFIELTIKSVIAQNVKPLKWIIVSDGSNDSTDEIVNSYTKNYNWIHLISIPSGKERNFAAKVNAFNIGYSEIKNFDFDIIGNCDADISFESDFFSFILNKFAENPLLGIGGTPFKEGNHQYNFKFANIEHVSGACLLFRRKCYEDIGGYTPIKVGGEELFAGLSARLKGWQTRTFADKFYIHHRCTNVKLISLKKIFTDGYSDYQLGLHPLWEIIRFPYKLLKPPLITGSIFHTAGYLWSMITKSEKLVSNDLIKYRKNEQIQRLKKILLNIFPCIENKNISK